MLDSLEFGFQKIWDVELFEEEKRKTSKLNVKEKNWNSKNKCFFRSFLNECIFFCVSVLCNLKLSYVVSWNNSPGLNC